MLKGSPERAKRMRMARAGAAMSHVEFARALTDRLGHTISRNMVQRWENGERDVEISVLVAVAAIADVSLSWLAAENAMVPAAPNGAKGLYLNRMRELTRNATSGGVFPAFAPA